MKTLGFCQPKDLGKQSSSCPVVTLAASDDGEHCLIEDYDDNSKDSIPHGSVKETKSPNFREITLSNKNGLTNSKHFGELLNDILVQSVVSNNSTCTSCVDSHCDKLCENSSSSLLISVPSCLPTVKQESNNSVKQDENRTLKKEPPLASFSSESSNKSSHANYGKSSILEYLPNKLHLRVDEARTETASQPSSIEVKTNSMINPLHSKLYTIPVVTNCNPTANLTKDTKDELKFKDCCKNYVLDGNLECNCNIPLKQIEEKSLFLEEKLKGDSASELPQKRISLINPDTSLENVISSDNYKRVKVTCSADFNSGCSNDFRCNAHLQVDLEGKNVINENSHIFNIGCKKNSTDAIQSPDVSKENIITIVSSNKMDAKGNDNGSFSTIVEDSQCSSVIESKCSNFEEKLKNDSCNTSEGNIVGNYPKLLCIEKNLNSPLSLSKSSSNTPMFSETPSDASQSDMMVKISDAVAALFSCTAEENLSEYVDTNPEEQKGDNYKFMDTENNKNKSSDMNLNFTDAFINKSESVSNSSKSSIEDPVLNFKIQHSSDNSTKGSNFLAPPSPSCYRQHSAASDNLYPEENEKSNNLRSENVPDSLHDVDLISNKAVELKSGELTVVKNSFVIPESAKTVPTESSTVVMSSLLEGETLKKAVCNAVAIPQQVHNSHSKIEQKCKNGFVSVGNLPLQTECTNSKFKIDSLTSNKCNVNEPLAKTKAQEYKVGLINKNDCHTRTICENVLKDAQDDIFICERPRNCNLEKCENVGEINLNNSLTTLVVKNKVANYFNDDLHLSLCKSEENKHLLADNSELYNDTLNCQSEIKLDSQGNCQEAQIHAKVEIKDNECDKNISNLEHINENTCIFISVKTKISDQRYPSEVTNMPRCKESSPVSGEELNGKHFSEKANKSCLPEDCAIFLNNSSDNKSSLSDFKKTYHADEFNDATENLCIGKSHFITENNVDMVKFSLKDFLHQSFEDDSGECNICKKFIESDLKLHAAHEHSCISYIPVYLSESFHCHMKERVGTFSIPSYNVTNDSPSFVCKTCGFILKSIESVRLHMNIHENIYMATNTNSFCKCKKKMYSYPQHKLKRLLLESSFICSFCNYCFACEYGLINHLKSSHFRMNSCLLCNVTVSYEDTIKVLAHNESHNTNTEQILSNLLSNDFAESLRDQTYFSWNALNNHLNYLDGKIFRLRTPENIINQKIELSIPVKADPEFAVTPDAYITSPALEISKYLKGKLVSQLTGTEIDEYASNGFDMPVQMLFQKKFCSKKGRKRNSNTYANKASSKVNNRFSISTILNLHKLHNTKHLVDLDCNSVPLRRSSRHFKSNLEDQNKVKVLMHDENEVEVDVHLTRTRSGMRPKENSEEDTSIGEKQEQELVADQQTTFNVKVPPAEISGEWENYHTFVCCSCGAVLYDLAAIMDHKWEAHPGVWCAHTMIRGQGAVPEMFCRQYLPSTIVPEVSGKKKISKIESHSYKCTQCKGNFSKLDRFHSHLIECGGLLQLFTIKKKARNKKNFRFRRRKGQGIPSQRYANNSFAPSVPKTFDSGTSTPSKDLPFQSHQRGSMTVVKRRLEMAVNSIENKELKSKLQVILSKTTHQKKEIQGQRRRTFKMKLRKKMQQKKALAAKQPAIALTRNRSLKVSKISPSPAKLKRSRGRNSIDKTNIYDEKVSGTAKVILQDIGMNEMKASTSKFNCSIKMNKNSNLTKKQRNNNSLPKENAVVELSNNTSEELKRKIRSTTKSKHQCHSSEASSELISNSTINDEALKSINIIKATNTALIKVNKSFKTETKAKKNVKERELRNSDNRTRSLPFISKEDHISRMEEVSDRSLITTTNCGKLNEDNLHEVPPADFLKATSGAGGSEKKISGKVRDNKTRKDSVKEDFSLLTENVSDSKVETGNENIAIIENSVVSEIYNNPLKSKLDNKKRNSFKSKILERFNSSELINSNYYKKGFKVCPAKLNYTKSPSNTILFDNDSKIDVTIGKDLENNVFKLHTTEQIPKISHLRFRNSSGSLNAALDNGKYFCKTSSIAEKSVTDAIKIKEEGAICIPSLLPKTSCIKAVNSILSVKPNYESLIDFANFVSNSTSNDKKETNCIMLSMPTRPKPNLSHKLPIFLGKTKKRIKRLPKNKLKISSKFQLIEKSSIYELSNAVSKCSLNSTYIDSQSERLVEENCGSDENINIISTTLPPSSKANIINDLPSASFQIGSLSCKEGFVVSNSKMENSNSSTAFTFGNFTENVGNESISQISNSSEQILNKEDEFQKTTLPSKECKKPLRKKKHDSLEMTGLEVNYYNNPSIKDFKCLVSENQKKDCITLNKNNCLTKQTFPEDDKKFDDSHGIDSDVCKKVIKSKKRFVRKGKKKTIQTHLGGTSEDNNHLENCIQSKDFATKIKDNLLDSSNDKVKILDRVKGPDIKPDYQKNIFHKIRSSMKKKIELKSIAEVALKIPSKVPPPVHIKRKLKLSTFIDLKDPEESKDDSDGASEPEVISNFRRERHIGRVGLRKRNIQSPRYSLRPPMVVDDKKSSSSRSTSFGNLVSSDNEGSLLEKVETCESDEEDELIVSPRKFRKCNIGDDDNVSVVSEVKSRRSSFSSDDEMLFQRIKKFQRNKSMEGKSAPCIIDHLEGDEEIFQMDFERSVIAKNKSTPNKISVMDQLCNIANQKLGRVKAGKMCFTDSSNFENIFNKKSNKGNLIKNTLNRLVCGASKKNISLKKRKNQKRLINRKRLSSSNHSKNSGTPCKSRKSLLEPANKRSFRRRSSSSRRKKLHMTPEIVPSDCDSVSDEIENDATIASIHNPCENGIIETSDPSQGYCTEETLEGNRLFHLNVPSNHVTMLLCENEDQRGEKLLEKRKKNYFRKDIKDKIVLQDNDNSFSQLNADIAKDDNFSSEKDGVCLVGNELFKKSKRKLNADIAKDDNFPSEKDGVCLVGNELFKKSKRKYQFSKKLPKDCIDNFSTGTTDSVRVLSYKSLNTGSLPIKPSNFTEKSDETFATSEQPDKLEETELPVKKKRTYKRKTKSELDENSPTVREIKRKSSVAAKIHADISVSNLDSGCLVEDPMALFCADCGLSFDSPFSHEDHQQDCRNIAYEMCLMDEDLLFECPYCQLTFALKSTQRQHTSSCRAKRSRKNSSRKRYRQSNLSNRVCQESKKNSPLIISNDQDLSALENVSQTIELKDSISSKESLNKNEKMTEMGEIANRLIITCEEHPEFCTVSALLYTLKLNTNDMRNLLTSSAATPSETVIQLHSNQLNCVPKNLDVSHEMWQIILEQSPCFNLPALFKSCLEKYSAGTILTPDCVQAIDNTELKHGNQICISMPRPELLQALSSIEDLLKEAEEVQVYLKKQQMLHAMKETFQAGTDS